jgi:hypothetical protein
MNVKTVSNFKNPLKLKIMNSVNFFKFQSVKNNFKIKKTVKIKKPFTLQPFVVQKKAYWLQKSNLLLSIFITDIFIFSFAPSRLHSCPEKKI